MPNRPQHHKRQPIPALRDLPLTINELESAPPPANMNQADMTAPIQPRETRGDMTKEPKDKSILLRLSESEHAAWKQAADESELALTEWIRQRCNGPEALAPERRRRS